MKSADRNYCIIGSGGREHAMIRKLLQEENTGNIHVCRGNPGMLAEWEKVHESGIDEADIEALISYIEKHTIDLVIIWPEEPLCHGMADTLRARGINVFWPNKLAAQLEWDKDFADQFNKKHWIPIPESMTYMRENDAVEALEKITNYPLVIKYPGLAGGKWVTIAHTCEDALEAIKNCFNHTHNTDTPGSVIVQEFLRWTEMSVFFFIDTTTNTLKYFTSAQDHKQRFEASHLWENSMTGGMWTLSPSPFEKDINLMDKIYAIGDQFLSGLVSDQIEYQWVVFIGLMITAQGPKVLEYNVRFGDPETQAMLARMTSYLGDALLATSVGWLTWTAFHFRGKSLNLVLTDIAYPDTHAMIPWSLIAWIEKISDIGVLHGWTSLDDRWKLVTKGGRILGLVATGDDTTTFAELNTKVLSAAEKISFDGRSPGYRRDIGLGKD